VRRGSWEERGVVESAKFGIKLGAKIWLKRRLGMNRRPDFVVLSLPAFDRSEARQLSPIEERGASMEIWLTKSDCTSIVSGV